MSVNNANFRGYSERKKLSHTIYDEIDKIIPQLNDDLSLGQTPDGVAVFRAIRKFMFIFNPDSDKIRFDRVCRYILATMLLPKLDTKVSYIAVGCSKDHSIAWIHQLKQLLWQCNCYLKKLRPEVPQDHMQLMLYLNMIMTFTSSATWNIPEPLRPIMQKLCVNVVNTLVTKGMLASIQSILLKGLCRAKPSLKKSELTAIFSISVKHASYAQLSESSINLFLVHILSTPGLIHQLASTSPDSVKLLSAEFFHAILDFLVVEQNAKILFNVLEANYSLCLLANVVHLSHLNQGVVKERIQDFVTIVQRLLLSCHKYVGNKQSRLTHWHPILGWFSQHEDKGLHEAMGTVKTQLSLLWSSEIVALMFEPLFLLNEVSNAGSKSTDNATNSSPSSNMFRRAIERASGALIKSNDASVNTSASNLRSIGSPDVCIISNICYMYTASLSTLTQLKLSILTGLCYHDRILPSLWRFISSLWPRNGLSAYLDHLALSTKTSAPEFQMLTLFCDCATHLVTILDDIEIYEKQTPFTLDNFIAMSAFLNNFVFRLVWNNLIDLKNVNSNMLLTSTHTLLMLLYKRDCRRRYAPKEHWLIKDLKISMFMKDLENCKRGAQILMQKVPHIIPHKERVLLFRKHVLNEKTVLGLTDSACNTLHSTMITVHRSRIVEDGYQQLAALPVQSVKGVIRVKFVNEQGLDEAGIDQDGVFKEFLEETIKKVFDPSLNLFRVTSEQRLYPSPTSFVHENHLSLFEFVGKVLGKAVYEGIVVDVPFASFFLGQVLGQQQSALYSSIDELPSLDPELYKNLTYIKHYDGDVSELGLTFSVDEDYMGKIVTHELMPGGRVVPVTKETRINYIHLMAHFRMHTQIREQTAAFIRGFRAIVNPEWLTMFSTPAFQRLVSGDNSPIDLADLRRSTKYYGGFHNNHRVIGWLWDVLEKYFSPDEHRHFLKFVTSCSKPPLLGFVHLEPPFSIRCVEVGDDQDIGDTVGSVLRGFFTIRLKVPVNRLPTSSTCFNLLKLPNYQKKSTLREKLRYAIMNNTGFELS